jgi:hypothetical protein
MFGKKYKAHNNDMILYVGQAKELIALHRELERQLSTGARHLKDLEDLARTLPPPQNLPMSQTPLKVDDVSKASACVKDAKDAIRRADTAAAKLSAEMHYNEFRKVCVEIAGHFGPLYRALSPAVKNAKTTYHAYSKREHRSAEVDKNTAKLKSTIEKLAPLLEAADSCHFRWRTMSGDPDTRGTA